MIETADNFLQSVQAAMVLGEMYSPDHPAVRDQERRSLQLISQLHASLPHVTFMALDDRVVMQNQRLPSSATLIEGIICRLRRRGIDTITFSQGLTLDELRFFISELRRQTADEPLAVMDHVRPGFIRNVRESEFNAATSPQLREHVASVESMWRNLQQNQTLTDDLASVLIDICRSVGSMGGASLPLASLKNHSEYTFVHTLNVGVLSAALAQALGLGPDEGHDLTIAALLHDIGKEKVPVSILEKAAQLSPEELRVIQRHPVDGALMLLQTRHVPPIAPIVAFEHHLAVDGTGYPAVPRTWRPHVASQIVQIADIFDALRTNRPYRPALSTDEALNIMCDGAGKRVDSSLLGVFIDRVARQAVHGASPDGAAATNDVPAAAPSVK
jgi:putative nucleotidyltransferase with HDIG domain